MTLPGLEIGVVDQTLYTLHHRLSEGQEGIGLRRSLPIDLEGHKWLPKEALLAEKIWSQLFADFGLHKIRQK